MRRDNNTFQFSGFQSPNYTQVPDELFDQLLPQLSGAELKVLLYIVRRTFGFKRESDAISLSQMLTGIRRKDGMFLDRGTGLSKPALLAALRALEEKRIIHTERRRSQDKGDEPTAYRLCVGNRTEGQESLPPVVKKVYQGGGKKSLPGPWSKKLTTQETVLQETDLSNRRKFSKTGEEREETDLTSHSSRDFKAIGQMLSQSGHLPQFSPKKGLDEDRQAIRAYVAELAQELGDEAALSVSLSRIIKLYQKSGRKVGEFIAILMEARSRTREYTAKIKKRQGNRSGGRKNQFPYFVAILEDALGLRDNSEKWGE